MLYRILWDLTVYFIICVKGFDSEAPSNVAVYWGQNSIEAAFKKGYTSATSLKQLSQPSLVDVCKDRNVDIVLISFMDNFPGRKAQSSWCKKELVPSISLFNGDFSKNHQHSLVNMEQQIRRCQEQFDTKVLLSLGGESGSYGFESLEEAETFADTLYSMFGNMSSTNCKPFGNVRLDGFDLDIEKTPHGGRKNQKYYVDFAVRLQQNFEDDHVKKFYLTAAPQCLYPDENLKQVLESDRVKLDFLFIQFYNNDGECNANTDGFNWEVWEAYAQRQSGRKTRLFMGLPGDASRLAADNGYIGTVDALRNKIQEVWDMSNNPRGLFAGVSLWEASLAYNNYELGDDQNYVQWVKKTLVTVTGKGSFSEGDQPSSSTASLTFYSVWLIIFSVVLVLC